jgi:hypothetical protein
MHTSRMHDAQWCDLGVSELIKGLADPSARRYSVDL